MQCGGSIPVPATITVRVEGGLVQDVEGIPAGVTVRVIDFDAGDSGDELGEPGVIEINGRKAWETIYEGARETR